MRRHAQSLFGRFVWPGLPLWSLKFALAWKSPATPRRRAEIYRRARRFRARRLAFLSSRMSKRENGAFVRHIYFFADRATRVNVAGGDPFELGGQFSGYVGTSNRPPTARGRRCMIEAINASCSDLAPLAPLWSYSPPRREDHKGSQILGQNSYSVQRHPLEGVSGKDAWPRRSIVA